MKRYTQIAILIGTFAIGAYTNCSGYGSSGGAFNLGASGSDPNVPCAFPGANSSDIPVAGKFLNDGHDDAGVWSPNNGNWYICNATTHNLVVQQWGMAGDIPVPADYDGDGKTDYAVFRPSNGTWYVLPSSNPGTPLQYTWGQAGDVPMAGDYDGDGRADLMIWRSSNTTYYLLESSQAYNSAKAVTTVYGVSGEIAIHGDFDGDGKQDIAYYNPANQIWYFIASSNGSFNSYLFGNPGDVPLFPADWDGDHRTDPTVWRPSTNTFFLEYISSRMTANVPGPIAGDIPVLGDFAGSGKTNFEVFRPSAGYFFNFASPAP